VPTTSDCDPQQRLARSLEGATTTTKQTWRLFDDIGVAVGSRLAQMHWRIAYCSHLFQDHTTGQARADVAHARDTQV
jgi:hypothetical protein